MSDKGSVRERERESSEPRAAERKRLEEGGEALGRHRQAIGARACVRVIVRNARKGGRLFWNALPLFPRAPRGVTMRLFGGIKHDVTEHVEARR